MSIVKNVVATAAEGTASLAWGTTRAAAQGLYNVSNWAWRQCPETGRQVVQDAWAEEPDPAATRARAILAGGVVASAAAVAAPPVAVLGAGLGVAGYLGFGPTHRTIVKVSGATAAAQLVGGILAMAIPGVAAAPIALGAGVATLLATYAGCSLTLNVPGVEAIPLEAVRVEGDEPILPPGEAVQQLVRQSATFQAKHPPEMVATLKEPPKKDDPQAVLDRQQQELRTNAALKQLIAHMSANTSVNFIFTNRLGLSMRSRAGVDISLEITQRASKRRADGTYPNLWDVSMHALREHGVQLTFMQRSKARFWYFLSDTIGIVPNLFKDAGQLLLKRLRGGIQEEEKLHAEIARIIHIADSFLERYISAMEQYANAVPRVGNLADYHKLVIDELGDAALVHKVKSELKPGEDLGQAVLRSLCNELVKEIVDDPRLFPPIPFFKNLRKIPLLGAVFAPCEWIFGGMLNRMGRSAIKAYGPAVLEGIVQKGFEQLAPGHFDFKLAIANAFKTQIDELDAQLNRGVPTKPLRFANNEPLNSLISKLTKTLELTTCHGDADKLLDRFQTFKTRASAQAAQRKDTKFDQAFNEAAIEGAQFLINHYTKHPEALENLLEKLFASGKEIFQDKPAATVEQYQVASAGLHGAVQALTQKLANKIGREKAHIESHIEDILLGKDERVPAHDDPFHPGQRLPETTIHHRGIFTQHKEEALEAAQLLRGLGLDMTRQLQADREPAPAVEPVPAPVHLIDPVIQARILLQKAKALVSSREEAIRRAGNRVSEEQTSALNKAKQQRQMAQLHLRAKKAVQARQTQFDDATKNHLPEAQFHLTTAQNKSENAEQDLEIATEQYKAAHNIEQLKARLATIRNDMDQMGDQPEALANARSQYQNVEARLNCAKEAENLSLITAKVKARHSTQPSDHLLNNLNNCMWVVDKFTQQITALNLDLYPEQVKNPMQEAFSGIYRRTLHLTDELIALQALSKRYDKSKRLSPLLSSVEAAMGREDAAVQRALVNGLYSKLQEIKEVDESFRRYEEDPEHHVNRFEGHIDHLATICQTYTNADTTLQRLQTLGLAETLGDAILDDSEKLVRQLHAVVPEEPQEDRRTLFTSIATLLEQAVPDLAAKQAVADAFNVILRKYETQKGQQQEAWNTERINIQGWAQGQLEETNRRRDQSHGELTEQLARLREDTRELEEKTEQMQLPPSFAFTPLQPAFPLWRGYLNGLVDDTVNTVTERADAAFTFATSEEIAKAIVLLTLGEVVHQQRR